MIRLAQNMLKKLRCAGFLMLHKTSNYAIHSVESQQAVKQNRQISHQKVFVLCCHGFLNVSASFLQLILHWSIPSGVYFDWKNQSFPIQNFFTRSKQLKCRLTSNSIHMWIPCVHSECGQLVNGAARFFVFTTFLETMNDFTVISIHLFLAKFMHIMLLQWKMLHIFVNIGWLFSYCLTFILSHILECYHHRRTIVHPIPWYQSN